MRDLIGRKFNFRFRWKYAFSAFFVLGVLSLTIGNNHNDPVLITAARMQAEYTRIFVINRDPAKGASAAAQDGPAEKTYPLDSPVLVKYVQDLYNFGQLVSGQSFQRASHLVSSPEINAVAKAAVAYEDLHAKLYKNYMRLAHDAAFKTYRTTSKVGYVFDRIVFDRKEASRREVDKWTKLNQGAVAAAGARSFSKSAYDRLNIRLDAKTAQLLFSVDEYKKKYNLRRVRGADGRYSEVELFVNSFEKEMAEYEAIADPKDKGEYLKLIQFAALREGMANRWAIRRVADSLVQASQPVEGRKGPLTHFDSKLHSCAADLVSFQFDGAGTLDGVEAYGALWQQDRYDDLMNLGADAAADATVGSALLTDGEYAELFSEYITPYGAFEQLVIGYSGDTTSMLEDFQFQFAPKMRAWEEIKWTSDRLETGDSSQVKVKTAAMTAMKEKFLMSSFPADDLSLRAVSERYTDQAFMMRALFLAEGLYEVTSSHTIESFDPYGGASKAKLFPETNLPAAKSRAMEIVITYLKPREAAWKKKVSENVQKALATKLGYSLITMQGDVAGIGYTRNRNDVRHKAYLDDVMPIAAIGARGVIARRAAEAAQEKLRREMVAATTCESVTHFAGTGNKKNCYLTYPDPAKMSAAEKGNPKSYFGYAPFRVPARSAGMTDILLPETADQLSQFFKKKLNAVLSYDNARTGYIEPKIAERLSKNEAVMHGMDHFFGVLASDVENGSAKGANGEAAASCAPPLASVDKNADRGKRIKSRKPAAADVTPEECSKPSSNEAEARRKALGAALLPAAKKAYDTFVKGLSTPGTYKDPARAAKKIAENKNRFANEMRANLEIIRPVQDNLSLSKVNPNVARLKDEESRKAAAAAALKAGSEQRAAALAKENSAKKWGYFRTGRDRSLDKTGGEFYVADPKQRDEAKTLFIEGLAMLGLAKGATGAGWSFRRGPDYLPTTVLSWVTTEHLLQEDLKSAGPLERMVSTITDQYAMGQVLAQEAISRAPILTLQNEWNSKKGEKKSPILLEKVARYWTAKNGWGDGSGYAHSFNTTLVTAAKNDIGKVETFCRADVKSYRTNDDFRTMFLAVSGIRDILGTDEKVRKWDTEITKESRAWDQAVMEDYIDPYSIPIMIAIGIVMAFQIAFLAVPTLVGAMTAASAGIGNQLLVGLGRLIFIQMTGNLGLVTLVFSFQSYLMVSVYHFRMPPQMNFQFQVANSRIQNMKDGKFAGGSLVDREKMSTLREELNSMQMAANFSLAAEVLQFGIFTHPGIRQTLGLRGAEISRRLASQSSVELRKKVLAPGLKELIKEKGSVKAGIKAYWEKAGPALKEMRRIPVVLAGKTVKEEMAIAKGMREMLGDRIGGAFIKDKAALRQIYGFLKEDNLREAAKIFATKNESALEFAAKKIQAGEIDLKAIQDEIAARIPAYQKKAMELGQDESFVIAIAKRDEERLLVAEGEKLLGNSSSRLATRTMALTAKAESFLKSAKDMDRLIDALEKAPVLAGETETQAFLRGLSPSDFENHRGYFKKARGYLDKDVRQGIHRAYKDYNYLNEDWTRINPDARAIGNFYRTGMPTFYINESGDIGIWSKKDYDLNAQNYSILTIGGRKLAPDLYRKKTVEKLKETLKSKP